MRYTVSAIFVLWWIVRFFTYFFKNNPYYMRVFSGYISCYLRYCIAENYVNKSCSALHIFICISIVYNVFEEKTKLKLTKMQKIVKISAFFKKLQYSRHLQINKAFLVSYLLLTITTTCYRQITFTKYPPPVKKYEPYQKFWSRAATASIDLF